MEIHEDSVYLFLGTPYVVNLLFTPARGLENYSKKIYFSKIKVIPVNGLDIKLKLNLQLFHEVYLLLFS